ncbi:phosphoenolpyruvate--protein phosphotransferase [Lentisphaerota bacterium ZTH]|nr:phosphoenolpyruvate--protein phosphotransferase [Lentisphaerota bacterium]WET05357.1 phosphoenolpyruvate--protein phosphotransferase [Lentisphaerota bacterium ZTH]
MQLKGLPASPGFSHGKVFILSNTDECSKPLAIDQADTENHISKFYTARDQTKADLKETYRLACSKIGEAEAELFEGYIDILMDDEIEEGVIERIQEKLIPVDTAVREVFKSIADEMGELDNEYFKERVSDMNDIGRQLLDNVLDRKSSSLDSLKEPVILVARDITPSEMIRIDLSKVLAFVTEEGGMTSHVSIIARGREIPAVVATGPIIDKVSPADSILINAVEGVVVINPSISELKLFAEKEFAYLKQHEELLKVNALPARTLDHKVLSLNANIGNISDVRTARKYRADGIGLFRTEFLFMDKPELPSEDEQFLAYKDVAEAMNGAPVIIRTLDIGGDKPLPYLDFKPEENPFLGWRGARISIDRPDIFRTQVRAALRASAFGNIALMIPMITSIEEMTILKEIIDSARKELYASGVKVNDKVEVGMMIETPAAVMMLDEFAEVADFFSIGSNDLTQYILAADRNSAAIRHLYNSLHPAVLRAVKQTVDAAHKAGKWVCLCGEMAGDKHALPILLGLGIDKLSLSPNAIPGIKKLIRSLSFAEMQLFAEKMIELPSTHEVQENILALLKKEHKI